MDEWSKGSELWMMFMDFWNLCKALWKVQDTDEYWTNAMKSCNEFAIKYGNKSFPRDLAMSLSNELERRYKNGKKA